VVTRKWFPKVDIFAVDNVVLKIDESSAGGFFVFNRRADLRTLDPGHELRKRGTRGGHWHLRFPTYPLWKSCMCC
jgi:hypothetical protein